MIYDEKMKSEASLRQMFRNMWPHFDERERRLLAAGEAQRIGYGGVSLISRTCGLSRVTIAKGIKDLQEAPLAHDKVRRPGAGRPTVECLDPDIEKALENLVQDTTRGDPESPLLWTCKSTRMLSEELTKEKHKISHEKVAQLLRKRGYSLQGNRKTEEGNDHPDRDVQFQYINTQVKIALNNAQPVISVDTKKKELAGNYANGGRQWRKKKSAKKVNGHDFPDPSVPRAYPYGIYDIGRNTGFVNIGTDHDTSAFAVSSIRGWWKKEGGNIYPQARWLVITADGGGSNGYRRRLWKLELQKLSNEIGIPIRICHFPPGTSKWNKVEHRLFSFISSNWRGEPLQDYETIVRLISATTTSKGLRVTCRLDHSQYPLGIKVTDEEMKSVHIYPSTFHGEWNYVIRPS
jgi:transposase